jgi:V/A-type H+-transporting ATPase subunit D
MSERGPATRLTLLRTRKQLERMEKGTSLLRRKREALVGELFHLAKPAASARAAISAEARAAYDALLEAYALEGQDGLRAWGWPDRDLRVDIRPMSVWGVPASTILNPPPVERTLASRETPPPAVTPPTVQATDHFERMVDRLVGSAPREMLLQRLGLALSRTTRQVNMLEQRLTPALEARLAEVRRRLDEREREEKVRLLRARAARR